MSWSFRSNAVKRPVTGWGLWAIVFLSLMAGCQPIAAPVSPVPITAEPDKTVTDPTAAARRELADTAGAATVAFVRAGVLYIQTGGAAAKPIEDCTEIDCRTAYLKWPPDGAHLLYYWGPAHEVYGEWPAQIRMADRSGQVQTVAAHIPYSLPPAWSPDGRHLAYLVATDRYQGPPGSAMRILEVWTADVSPGGRVQNPQHRGEIGFNEGCGGGGWSESADAYEGEGGFLYLGFWAAILEWTAADLVLFSNNCFAQGVGRFDLGVGLELAPYGGGLHSLALNAAKNAWVAIDDDNRMVLGAPTSLAYKLVATQAQPKLVFFGQLTGDLYYTTLEVTGRMEFEDSYFEFTRPGLRVINMPSMVEKILWEGDGYGYARVAQGVGGTIFFSRVEDNTELYQAIKNGELTKANLSDLLPQVAVLWLPPSQSTPTVWLANAAQFALAPPSGATGVHSLPMVTAATDPLLSFVTPR